MVHNVPHGNVIGDVDGFGPPQIGGTVNAKYGTVGFANTTAKTLFTLPAGAIIIRWIVNVVTAFNSSGSDLLDIGITGSAAAFADDLDVSATGQIPNGYVPGQMFTPLTVDTPVIATYIQSVADADAGEAIVLCEYILL